MNLAIVESTLDTQMGFERARRTVLHEFGHAIWLLLSIKVLLLIYVLMKKKHKNYYDN